MRIASGLLFALTLLLSLTVCAQADLGSISLRGGESHLTLSGTGSDMLSYEAEIGSISTLDVDSDVGTFTRLMIPGFHSSQTVGAPQLPMMNRLIEVPFGAIPRIEVVSVESHSINLADYGITNQIFPAQLSMPKNVDPADWPFAYDLASYETHRVAQDLVSVEMIGTMRAATIGRVQVSPVEYYPGENRLEVFDKIEFRVVFDNADFAGEVERQGRTYSPFFDVVYNRLDGSRSTHDDHPDRVGDEVTMVVVAPPMFESQLAEYVTWKTVRGFNTILAITGTPEVGTTSASIQAYIHDLYNNPPEGQAAPSFIVIFGDVAQVPTFTEGGDESDRPYGAVDGDLIPDIYYGRLSATNSTQLAAILDKTLEYDQYAMPDPSFLGEVVMIAGHDSGFGQVHGNGQINYGTSNYFNAAHGILSHTYLYPESQHHSADIIADVSNGCAYVNYTAHGSQTSWANPSFTISNINSLQNAGKYPLVVGNCCLTGSYEVGECFGEAWIRADSKGGIGYIGASNNTQWDPDYWWGVGSANPIVEFPTYEATGLGAYDGMFHDHGEAVTQWYVCNDAVIFSGNLAVTEAGSSSSSTYYWNIYNLSGDPSLSVFYGVPTANPVVHPATIFTTWSSFEVEAVPNSYVGLTKGGELIGAGTVGENGVLDLQMMVQPLTPGPAHLVVMAQNRIPYEVDLNIIVPAAVYNDPTEIDANVETEISVGVFEYDGVTPKPGIEVWASGLLYETAHRVTGADGYCTVTVNYAYGPTLDIVGQDPAESWELFRTPIDVNATTMFGPNLSVSTNIGLANQFANNLPGTLTALVNEPGHTLYAFLNGEFVDSTTDDELTITPDELGEVTGIIAISGYDIFSASFPVIEAYGTLTGNVDNGRSPAANAIVTGYDAAMEEIFTTTTNAAGNYDVGVDIPVGPYTITVDCFGSLHYEQAFFLNYQANVLDITMTPAPSGVLTGTITEFDTGIPLEGTVKVYRSDNMELYETAYSGADGVFTTVALPYFDYQVDVKAWHHIPVYMNLTVEEPVVLKDFVLEQTIGDLLLIDDSSGSLTKFAPLKLDEKTGEIIAAGYEMSEMKASADIIADLEDIGYTVTLEDMTATDPVTWSNYDLIIASGGDNNDPFADATFRAALVAYVDNGGHLLLEGGEVAYDHQSETEFAERVMHVSDWTSDSSGNITIADAAHALTTVPNIVTGPITLAYNNYGDSDACDITADAQMVGSWTSQTSNASIIAYDSNPAPEGGQIVFYLFNYSSADAAVRSLLLQNTITYLMAQEVGNCSVSGTAILNGEGDHSGITVSANPGGGTTVTNAAGEYSLPGLYAGAYTIRAEKSGWGTRTLPVILTDGQQMTDVDFELSVVYEEEICDQPALSIPDNNPTGVYDEMDVVIGEGAQITLIEVYVDITHTFQGDLIAKLTSPTGTEVILHNRSGSGTDNIIGWYPGELSPDGDLDLFLGEETDGAWRLSVSDHASTDTGTLNEWCLIIGYSGGVSDVEGELSPKRVALFSNTPNPMHSSSGTMIRFALPTTSQVDLSVFDLNGRCVQTLVSGEAVGGSHSVIWDGKNGSGQPVSGGIYFYRLKADGKTLTRKMTILR